jgi:hypothetical protein
MSWGQGLPAPSGICRILRDRTIYPWLREPSSWIQLSLCGDHWDHSDTMQSCGMIQVWLPTSCETLERKCSTQCLKWMQYKYNTIYEWNMKMIENVLAWISYWNHLMKCPKCMWLNQWHTISVQVFKADLMSEKVYNWVKVVWYGVIK